ncbi:DNA polymerase Y family protein [Undibacterium sp. RTI2.1]|uniref:Y-family DNA polymerase n=1 Tax=unclassified Undibacterium TaxID=2630295 RepID=UPI002AB34C25|nr:MULTISPECIES: DNA polymerase Y family protein [unclassified Undibacterium]MDY7537346.1 DNA polymerase Y family protein [Undibacterium sp. 5I1]MEB0032820.1 DNA polymerase Y family protein [Undibacterium sp. RTI2.1]MEB0118754.1 DNA polymerase Y family protein [Undibacterium sp. RTI2.2]MEB0232771.1 DNA polymerase Y family protein [Undibacterium sp. 10I3]MEB0259676.1 DNA polymerase Y family protein [Undibacterium sp. 5I1]
MTRLWIALHLPLLQLEIFRPNWLTEQAAVVLEQNRITCASVLACHSGAQIGMRKAGLQMLLPSALFYQRQPALETRALQQVAMALLNYTPQVAYAGHDCLLMDIGASLRLFGGIRALCRRIKETMRVMGMTITLSCAPTAMGAWLLARNAASTADKLNKHSSKSRRQRPPATRILKLNKLVQSLDSLPVHLLPAATPWLDWLRGIACDDLGTLQKLPRAGLKRRCGKQILDVLDQAYGEQVELFEWIAIPPQFKVRIDMPDRIEHAEMVLAFIRSLLTQLMGWLTAKQLAVSQVDLQLEHERGRQAIAPTLLSILLAEPVWREDHLIRLLKERLAQVKLEAPVIAVSLDASQVQAMHVPNATLFPEPKAHAENHHRLLELLVARLGDNQVLQAAPLADHRPEIANHWTSVIHQQATEKQCQQQQPPLQASRPMWLLEKAIAIEIRQHRPYYQAPLKLLTSAERIEAGWWNGQLVTRDYFVAENPAHIRYWIYRERLGEQTDTNASWFVHGVFG